MRLSYEQVLSDEKDMTDFICERLTAAPTKLILSAGEEGETWAELWPDWDDATGWNLSMETSDEEVDLEDVYDHLRRKEMTLREWWREFEFEANRSKVFRLEQEIAVIQQGRCDLPPGILAAHDIVEYYQGKISLRLAYQIMEKCKPVRAEGKRLISAESFDEYLRAIPDETPQDPPQSSEPDESATSRKRPGSRADDGFEFFRFPH